MRRETRLADGCLDVCLSYVGGGDSGSDGEVRINVGGPDLPVARASSVILRSAVTGTGAAICLGPQPAATRLIAQVTSRARKELEVIMAGSLVRRETSKVGVRQPAFWETRIAFAGI
jgi:hypothetical protein